MPQVAQEVKRPRAEARKMRLFLLFLLLTLPALAQDADAPWFLGPDGGVYYVSAGKVSRLGLASGSSLAVSAGVPWLIGNDGKVWTTRGDRDRWAPIAEPLVGRQIVAGSGGSVFLLGTDGGVYQRLGAGQWKRVGLGTGSALGVGPDDVPYLVGTDGRIWRGQGGNWLPYNALAKGRRLAVGQGAVYLVGEDAGVYRVTSSSIDRLGLASAVDVALSPSGQVYIVGTDSGVWSWDGGNWSRLGWGTAREVTFNR